MGERDGMGENDIVKTASVSMLVMQVTCELWLSSTTSHREGLDNSAGGVTTR